MFLQDSDITTPAAAAAPSHFPCSGCGAALTFEPGAGRMSCGHCGFANLLPQRAEDIPELDYHAELLRHAELAEQVTHASLHCAGCGAELMPPAGFMAGSCPFCDLPFVGQPRRSRSPKPAGMLPFCVTREQALESFRRWLASLWMAPSGLARQACQAERLQGVYLPYCVFSCVATSFYSGQRGRRHTGHDGKEQISWRPVIGWVKDVLDHVLVPAARARSAEALAAVGPWDLARLEPYDERCVSGYLAESSTLQPDEAFQAARRVMDERIALSVRAAIGGHEQRIGEIKSQYEHIQFKHILLPVWVSSYRFRDQAYRLIINGRTAAVHGDRPHDSLKIILAGAAGLAAASGLGLLLTSLLQE